MNKALKNSLCLLLVFVSMSNSTLQVTSPRRLLLFGEGLPAFKTQQQWLEKDSLGLAERSILVEEVPFNDELAKKYNVRWGEFTVLLMGRDGGEKYRAHEPVSTKKLFAIIDAMPMRQAEMQKKPN